MFEVYAFSTPNSVRVPVALEEMGLAEKTGKLLPSKGEARSRVFEQIFFHVTGIGLAFGQAGYFQKQAPELIPHALTRFNTEAARVMTVFEGKLSSSIVAAGDQFTIADIAHFG
jgi:glutathione S-transferase